MTSKKSQVLYLVYLVVVVSLGLEGAARLGILETEVYFKAREIRSLDGRPFVLLIGDSFSLEYTPDAFASLLRTSLAEQGIALVNLSIPGTGPRYYLRSFKQYGTLAKPQIVLVNYYVGNDITDTAYKTPQTGMKAWVKQLALRFYFGHYLIALRNDRLVNRRLSAVAESDDLEWPALAGVSPFLIELRNHYPEYLLENILLRSERAQRAWEENMSLLRDIKHLAHRIEVPLLINIFPRSIQINRSHFPFFADLGFELDEELLANNIPQTKMLDFCAAERLDCLDLLPVFRGRATEEFYADKDDHWNPAGNRLAFNEVWQHLEAHPHLLGARQ